VNWFVARAQKDRWNEEVEILTEEMKCVLRYFAFFEDAWVEIALCNSQELAIASNPTGMSMMYRSLKEDVLMRFPMEVKNNIIYLDLSNRWVMLEYENIEVLMVD